MDISMDQAFGLKQISKAVAGEKQRKAGSGPVVISVSSGKGGVGKTNVVLNTAIALRDMGKRVLILDADMGLANIDVMLGIAPKYNIAHVLSGQKGIREVLVQGPKGILILPASSGTTEFINMGESEKLFLLEEMEELGDEIDIMLIDNSAGISGNVLYFNIAAGHRVIIVTPEPTSITDAYALIKILVTRHKIKDFSLIVNQVRDVQDGQRVFKQLARVTDRFLGALSLDYLGCIFKDEHVSKAICQQQALIEIYPESEASKAIREVASRVLSMANSKGEVTRDGNIKFFWQHLFLTWGKEG